MRSLTISRKLAAQSAAALAFIVGVYGVGHVSIGTLGDSAQQMRRALEASSHANEADMAHDAVRGDVALAVASATSDATSARLNRDAVRGHVNALTDALAAAKQLHISAEADAAVDALGPSVAEYGTRALEVADAAASGVVASTAQLAAFDAAFKRLQDDIPTVASAIERTTKGAESDTVKARGRGEAAMLGITLAAAAILGSLAVVVTRSIVRPVRRTVGVLGAVAAGDLTTRLDVGADDEVGEMAVALNTALDNLARAMSGIDDHAAALAEVSVGLTGVAQEMTHAAEGTATQAAAVAAASEQVSFNVGTVAAGSDEMTVSIQEIAGSAQLAVQVAGEAARVADETTTTMAKLEASSVEVGSVVRVITSIAEQTNLLALNATIEAARAGEMGKGFAVVANEVKDLARATGEATADISRRITAIQGDAAAAVLAIAAITAIIDRVAETQGTIASAVEEQTATTSEIGRNITQAAMGSSEISSMIGSMAASAAIASDSATHTRDSASELSQTAAELRALVGAFRTK